MKYLLTAGLIAWIAATATVLLADGGKETCFYKSDRIDGLNKLCYYSCPSGEAVMTIRSIKLCPLTWHRD